ncbi:hypothetical protein EDD22DRAFT_848813 [Suillus occidentalis]|nr:hypothetical protein EDD22DRAFT_848813 [Suillus occidentalis]
MCQHLKFASDEIYKGYFVDLYVCCNNALAINMYKGIGYRVGKDGRDEEDVFDMVCHAMSSQPAAGLQFYTFNTPPHHPYCPSPSISMCMRSSKVFIMPVVYSNVV